MFGIGKKKNKKATAAPEPAQQSAPQPTAETVEEPAPQPTGKHASTQTETGAPATPRQKAPRHARDTRPAAVAATTPRKGPFDESDGSLTELLDPHEEGRTIADFGAYAFVAPTDAQLQIEMSPEGNLAVHILIGNGHITMDAYAAPKSGGQWRMVVSELADGLRAQGATVSIQDGPWGREVVGTAPGSVIRFIGADGPRWMLRTVVVSSAADADQSAELARDIFAHTVVRRGMNAMPARTPIPLVLPTDIMQQVQAEQMRQNEAARLAAEEARQRMSE